MPPLFKLRRFLDAPPAAPRKATLCEFCGLALDVRHSHVVDLDERRLMCTCRPCYLLFTHSGAAHGRYRSVSERVLKLPDSFVAGMRWEALQVPVGIAFFLRDSARNRVVAFYPSPAGATESGLPIETWDEMVAEFPILSTIEPDTEALLACRRRKSGPQNMEAWIVPIDACYELVGRIRRNWSGLASARDIEGSELWTHIDAFFDGLRERDGGYA